MINGFLWMRAGMYTYMSLSRRLWLLFLQPVIVWRKSLYSMYRFRMGTMFYDEEIRSILCFQCVPLYITK